MNTFATTTTANGTKSVLTLESINQRVRTMEYAVRGVLPIRAEGIQRGLDAGESDKYAFNKTVFCNIGNPQQLGQKPLTYLRQLSALVDYPELLSEKNYEITKQLFPEKVIERAKETLNAAVSVGAYSGSTGLEVVRRNVAAFIEKRDGFPSDFKNIQLTNGASGAVERVLELLVAHDKVGIMIPIPQYPLYSASLTRFGAHAVSYYLQEQKEWGLDINGLKTSVSEARAKGIEVRALVIINPGNPTGSVLTLENMEQVVRFCEDEGLVLLADEVYQQNVYYKQDKPFHSFKKVVSSLKSSVELFSFHSISKGMIGECGRRGGYLEMHNIPQPISDVMFKMASVSLCPNVLGQIAVDVMVKPPSQEEDPESHKQYNDELKAIYDSLKRRAEKLCNAFNSQENINCNVAEGSMYLFPQIKLPAKFVQECKDRGDLPPDQEYSLAMLNATGVCVVPGSGFGQVDGTYHFRCTFLPPEGDFDQFVATFGEFNQSFIKKYSN
ncbi:putative alanine aminotransferase, mitochondrial [Zancudomyces culisetae]|uniref:Glutamate pyruvate transaminase n=1 Tax=Zancudomyces culisetae TaxID=1213189 RepID=A0A1R1PYV7_ZANCU|nr:putative alanine aminotransferase, mitochondrial [Zancudomyces culisetae]|eukprot:OMH86140.1 putative alanine aminotransferase, mitochondrial [Zancudomyces culisetae]